MNCVQIDLPNLYTVPVFMIISGLRSAPMSNMFDNAENCVLKRPRV